MSSSPASSEAVRPGAAEGSYRSEDVAAVAVVGCGLIGASWAAFFLSRGLDVHAADPGVDAILVMNCPTAIADPAAAAEGVIGVTSRGRANSKPVLTCWLGKQAAEPARAKLSAAGLGTFSSPAQAAEAVMKSNG